MSVHSKIGASSYYRWKACPGSVKLCENIESITSSYARGGHVAHEIAAGLLEDHFFQKGKPAIPAGYDVDELDAIKVYVDVVKRDAHLNQVLLHENHLLIEHKFDLSSVHPGLFGTADCVLYATETKKLFVYDYKHGAGVPVDVEGNLQLQYYGLGALLSSGLPCSEVELVVCQPRCPHSGGATRRWSFSSIELLDYAAQLSEDAKATEKDDAPVIPGSHCRWCPAAASACPALREKSLDTAKSTFSPVDGQYEPEKLKEALDSIPALEAWITQVREFAYTEAKHGRTPPGYKLVAKRATRKWTDEKSAEEMLYLENPTQEWVDKKLWSVAKVEKALGKKVFNEMLGNLVSKESTGNTLVPETDKRPSLAVGPAEVFKPVTGETK